MGHPKDTSGCHCVLSLCHLMYCHLPKYLTMAYEKIQKMLIPPNWHQSCHSSVYMAHSKSSSNLSPSCSFTHSASDHPSTPPPVATGRFRGPWPPLATASTAAPAASSCSTTAAWPRAAAPCSGVRPQAPKGSETSTAGGLHPVALHCPPPLQWEKFQSVEWSPWVSSFTKLYSELAQWQPLSLLLFVKIAKTTNWWNRPQQKIRKRENHGKPFSYD